MIKKAWTRKKIKDPKDMLKDLIKYHYDLRYMLEYKYYRIPVIFSFVRDSISSVEPDVRVVGRVDSSDGLDRGDPGGGSEHSSPPGLRTVPGCSHSLLTPGT